MPTVRTNASIGDNRRGKIKPLPNAVNRTWENPAAVTPTPTSAPVIEWVVDIGRPNLAATSTVAPAPSAMAVRNGRWLTTAPSTSFAPLKFAASALPSQIAVSEPRNVKPVAQAIARLYEVNPAPQRVATPLKLSFAPFAKLRRPTARINRIFIAPPSRWSRLIGRIYCSTALHLHFL